VVFYVKKLFLGALKTLRDIKNINWLRYLIEKSLKEIMK